MPKQYLSEVRQRRSGWCWSTGMSTTRSTRRSGRSAPDATSETETAPGYHGYRNNNRPVQPLNGRSVRLRRGGLHD
jgi:hypothetical protein